MLVKARAKVHIFVQINTKTLDFFNSEGKF